MLKFIKCLIGILMLPLIVAVSRTFMSQLQASISWNQIEITTWWFAGGFVIWLLLFMMLPRPVSTYVLGHELTHALWGMLMGAKVSRLNVSSKGGSVTLTKSNLLITLAPYFFPFYSVIMLATYLLVNIWWDTSLYRPFWYALFGLTWAFHLTFTISMLAIHQPDIHEHGRIFSYTLIYCINLITAAYLVNLLTERNIAEVGPILLHEIKLAYLTCWQYVQPLTSRL
jgi:hypothetical protein